MMEHPELTSECYAGPMDGRAVRIDKDVAAIVFSSSSGIATYRKDDSGGLRFDPAGSVLASVDGDRLFNRIVGQFGLDNVVDVLAITGLQEAMRGNFEFWRFLAERVSRMREAS